MRKNYSISLRVRALADSWRLQCELIQQAQEVVFELCEECQPTVLLLVLDGTRGVCLHKVEPKRTIKLVADIGKTFPLHAAACGKVLLAHAQAYLQQKVLSSPLKAFTQYTVTDPLTLQDEIREIREKGYALSLEELTIGVAEVASPQP
ncbi:MAG: hypothetical protein CSA35_03855 [Dethiosulfovibrio peptidovorans]|nr:MAG: hypothetical protein CSA35_03855 [Dethiosulfovibrio peptidovorans]